MNKEKYTLQEVTTPALEREWLDFPKRIYKGNRNWVCPLDVDVLEVFNPSKNELFADGEAVGANPLHVIIPCHRVVEKSGRIGGYAGGGAVKFELLAREGKVVSVNAVPGRGFTRLIADAIPKVMG